MQHLLPKPKTRGFAEIVVLIAFGVIAVASLLYAAHESQMSKQATFGATVYTTQLSDTIGTFRTQVNSSTANLNTELVAVSTTIHAYGTIVSQNTPLGVSVGGTGTTTVPAANQYLESDGTRFQLKTIVASSGIAVTRTATATLISTLGFDATLNIGFTGNNTFAGSSTFNGITIIAATTTINGITTVNQLMTFNSFPVAATTTPTSSLQLAPKGYVDSISPLFIISTSTTATYNSSTAVGLITSTFTLSNPGRVLVIVQGDAANSVNGDGCVVFVQVDGVKPTDHQNVRFQYGSGVGANTPFDLSFSYITASLTAAQHTITLLGNIITGGTCSPSLTLQNEFIGR